MIAPQFVARVPRRVSFASSRGPAAVATLALALLFSADSHPRAQGRGGQAVPQTPRAAAPIDMTGYWVAIISEDWRWRMVTPSRGDFPSVPLNLAAQKIAEAGTRPKTKRPVNSARPMARQD